MIAMKKFTFAAVAAVAAVRQWYTQGKSEE